MDLTAKEFALMELFMRRRGEILPRALLNLIFVNAASLALGNVLT
ncbi:hypothetical protein [Staphylococcus aureus]